MIEHVMIYLTTGAFAGLLAGFLGTGGGVIIVPILQMMFMDYHGFTDHAMHMAIATSLSFMVVNASFAAWKHHQRHNVAWKEFKRIAFTLFLGAILGAFLASILSSPTLRELFAVFSLLSALYVFYQMARFRKKIHHFHQVPIIVDAGFSFLVGCLSTILGIGGSTLFVPYLLWKGHSMRIAVGTAAAFPPLIAVIGTLIYIYTGLGQAHLPPHAIGFIYLPALIGLLVAGIPFSYIGVRFASYVPEPLLKGIFVIFMLIVSYKMFHIP